MKTLQMKDLNLPSSANGVNQVNITEEEFVNTLLDNTKVVVEKAHSSVFCYITALYVLSEDKTEILEVVCREITDAGTEFYKLENV